MFREQILKGFVLEKTFHFAFNPSGRAGVPLQVSAVGMLAETTARVDAYPLTGRLCKSSATDNTVIKSHHY